MKIPKILVEGCSFLLIFIWLYLIAMRGVALYDDNAVYTPALKVAQGQIIYKEAYTQYGPIMVYIQAMFIRIFGERMWSVRLSAICFYIIAFYLCYYLLKMYLPYWLSLLIVLILALLEPAGYGVFHSWSSIYALAFEMALIIFFINYIKTNKYMYVVLSGLDAGIIFFCRQSCGIVFITGMLILWGILGIVIKKNIIKNIIGAIGGLSIVVIVFVLYFYFNGCFYKWINDALLSQFGLLKYFWDKGSGNVLEENITGNQLGNSIGANRVVVLFKCLFPVKLFGIYFVLPFIVIINLIYFSILIKQKKMNRKSMEIGVIAFFCATSWHQYFPIEGELMHVYWGAFPMVGLLAINTYEISKVMFRKNVNFITCMILFMLIIPTLFHRVGHSVNMVKNHNVTPEKICYWTNGLKLTEEENDFFVNYYCYINNLKKQYSDLIIYNLTSLYLPECYIGKEKQNTSAMLYITQESGGKPIDKIISVTDSFSIKYDIFMYLELEQQIN